MKIRVSQIRTGMACVLVVIVCSSCGKPAAPSSPASSEAPVTVASSYLDFGWGFACAITNDAKDRAKCQEKVALACLSEGKPDQALMWGRQIEGWRKSVVLAESAAWLTAHRDTNRAVSVLQEVKAIGRTIDNWQYDRVQMHIAQAEAMLGKTNETGSLFEFYHGNRDCYGRSGVYHALALARSAQPAEALRVMKGLGETNDFETVVWRTKGYMLLADAGGIDSNEISGVMEQAWQSISNVPGPLQHELRMDLLEKLVAAGKTDAAGVLIADVKNQLMGDPIPPHIKIPLLAGLAVSYGTVKNGAEVEALFAHCEPIMLKEMPGTEYPEIYNLFGEAYARAGDSTKSITCYKRAAELIREMTNLRPRAMCAVDLVLSLQKSGCTDETVMAGVQALLRGFHAPSL